MAGLLGEVDTNIPSRAPLHGKPVKSSDRRKTRVLSPPLENREPAVDRPRHSYDTPPVVSAAQDDEDDAYFAPQDDDIPMSDPLPSSPAAKAVERKEQSVVVKSEPAEDDDLMEGAEVQGLSTVRTANVNI